MENEKSKLDRIKDLLSAALVLSCELQIELESNKPVRPPKKRRIGNVITLKDRRRK